jgi:hypothetical protein
MRATEFLSEGLNQPIICVDVQPEYAYYGNNDMICQKIIQFVAKSTGPVLFYMNAEDQGMSGDTVDTIKQYWEESMGGKFNDKTEQWEHTIDWSRFTLVDKGYGYLRAWMDGGIPDAAIIKTIRMMYQAKVSDSRELFGGQDSETYAPGLKELLGPDYITALDDPLSVGWTNVAQLRKFNGAYIVGGGRGECLREVELLMNAFNIKYKRIDSLVYG